MLSLNLPLQFMANYTFIYALPNLLNLRGDIRMTTVIFNPNNQREVAGELNRILKIPITLNAPQSPKRDEVDYREPSALVLILDPSKNIDYIENNTIISHETVYVLFSNNMSYINFMMSEFWQKKFISAYALFFDEGNNFTLYGYEPTPDGIVLVVREKIEQVILFNCHGLKVNVSVAHLPPSVILNPDNDMTIEGIEGRLMVEIAKKFNVEPHYAVPRDGEWWGWLTPKPTGIIGEVTSGYSAFGFGIMAITDTRLVIFDQMTGYYVRECVTWAVPKGAGAASAPWVEILTTEFPLDTWATIAASFISVLLASKLVDQMGLGETVFRIFASSINCPIPLPTKSSSRVLFLAWVWVSFVLCDAYTSSMGSKLAVPPTDADINSYEDLYDSNLPLYGLYNSIRLMKAEHPVLKELAKRSIPTKENIRFAFRRMVATRDFAFMYQKTLIKYNAIINPESREGIHVMDDCAFAYDISIAMKKWSPYFFGASQVARRLFDSGIIQNWATRFMPELQPVPKPQSPLSFGHLFGVFVILLAGHGLSITAFCFELFLKGGSICMQKIKRSLRTKKSHFK